jgi:hypothetical protein
MELRSVDAIARTLNAADVRYIVVGGLAVNAHGYERFTNYIDLVISLEPDNVCRALHALSAIGYRPAVPITPEQFADADNRACCRDEKAMLVLKLWSDEHRRTPIDVFIQEPFNFDEQWQKAIRHRISETADLPIVSYEALILMKQSAGREKDLLDISALRKIEPHRP